MGLNPDDPLPAAQPDDVVRDTLAADGVLDDLAVYALDAVDGDEARAIETRLATDPDAAALEVSLRTTAGTFAAGATGPGAFVDTEPPAGLRARVLEAAFATRAPQPIEPATAVEIHRVELDRFESLLRRLTPEQWALGVDPPEFAGWTIHDLAAHVTANEGLLAQLLGLTAVAVPETANSNDERTADTIARHRALTPAATIAELHDLAVAVDESVSALDPEGLDQDLSWWGSDMRILTVLLVRSFETWTHADDIRRALGHALLPPPAPALRTMAQAATSWTPLMLALAGHDHHDQVVRFELTGAGGTTFDIDLGGTDRDVGGIEPDATITVDIVDYCRAIGQRELRGPLAFTATGNQALVADVIEALPALATL